jgi:excisionase family DNA binding protein
MKQYQDAPPHRIMTVAEVAQYFQVHTSTVYKLARNGQIPVFKIGADYRFYRDAIEKWTTDPTSEGLIQGKNRSRL